MKLILRAYFLFRFLVVTIPLDFSKRLPDGVMSVWSLLWLLRLSSRKSLLSSQKTLPTVTPGLQGDTHCNIALSNAEYIILSRGGDGRLESRTTDWNPCCNFQTHDGLFFLTVLGLVTLALAQDCEYIDDEKWECIGKGLTSVPPYDPSIGFVDFLDLKRNRISSISQDDFSTWGAVVKFKIDQNDLSSVPGFCFSRMPDLVSLNLQNNKINHLDDDAFQGVPKLSILEMSGNDFTEINPVHLSGIPKLVTLAIGLAQISTLDVSLFQSTPRLKKLYLNGNPLGNLNAGQFDNLSKLQVLNLNNIGMDSLPDGLFEDLVSLNWLDLRDNALSTLEEAQLQNADKSPLVLELAGNPLNCCPDLVWLKEDVLAGKVTWEPQGVVWSQRTGNDNSGDPPECVDKPWEEISAENCPALPGQWKCKLKTI